MIDLHERHDEPGEAPSDQLLVGRRAGVRVIGGLIGEMLDEQQVVRPYRVAVDAEGQGPRLLLGSLGRKLLDDCLSLGLLAGLELDGEYLGKHGWSSHWSSECCGAQ